MQAYEVGLHVCMYYLDRLQPYRDHQQNTAKLEKKDKRTQLLDIIKLQNQPTLESAHTQEVYL